MGAVPSTPRWSGERPPEAEEHLIGAFVGEKSYPISSEFWKKLLELPLDRQWPQHRVAEACQIFAQNNYQTRHLAKILVHMVWCLQECMTTASGSSLSYMKAVNATYISSVFLKFIIENATTDTFEELYLSLDDAEAGQNILPLGERIESYVMQGVLNFIGTSDVNAHSCLLHHELLNFMMVAMSTQLCSGPTPAPKDVHPFIDAAMLQEGTVVTSVVRRLLLNFITRPRIPFRGTAYPVYSDGNEPGVLQRVGSAAANFVLLPYYTFNYLVSSSGEVSRSPLADISLLVLLILIHYRKCVKVDMSTANNNLEDVDSRTYLKENSVFYDNPYCKALENARDIEFDRVDIEGNAQNGPLVRLPFASLFDTLGLCLAEESSVLLLYSLLHGNSDFLEYVLVRTDLDTLLMPILETLYNASRRTSNQIYMLLIILLILSQDSSFNASIHKLILLNVPWYKERLLHHTSLGSLMVVILIRTVKYNLSKLRDVYLHTNCLAILANMAPHVHRLSAYASQRLVSLFDMLSRKYTKLAELKNDKIHKITSEQDGDSTTEDMSTELHIYTDFLRIVLEILNAIITYALPRNPEVVYAIMHRQEVFLPFKSHPRFNELLENIYTVLDFFNSRMDMQRTNGGWSVDDVLQVIIMNCRSWRGEGMKMFTQLRFTYEQESHPEEFFIPYVWRLVLSHSSFSFNPDAINLLHMDLPDTPSGEVAV
ncbi:dymeclin isoform X3 [Asparagus officinalis]|uniref:dymeclin isoform X3 n=1 Tax=Asparagus officinalis TaxID=4686 RepID=UPI00098E5777|nr:dymeclin isoform X3 [Asparagus officinalis]